MSDLGLVKSVNPMSSMNTVKHHLLNQKRSSAGPDHLPCRFWKYLATELATIVTEIFNTSLKTSNVPQIWKPANLLPLSKESPLNSCSQLRPISLTDIIMRLFERYVYKTELAPAIRYKLDLINLPTKKVIIRQWL